MYNLIVSHHKSPIQGLLNSLNTILSGWTDGLLLSEKFHNNSPNNYLWAMVTK